MYECGTKKQIITSTETNSENITHRLFLTIKRTIKNVFDDLVSQFFIIQSFQGYKACLLLLSILFQINTYTI